MAPRATVVVPAWNAARWLPDCLRSLQAQTLPHRVVVVDDGSTDGCTDRLEADWPGIEVVRRTSNGGFAAAANTGIDAARTPYVALLNTDTRPRRSWLEALVARLDASPPEVGAVASKMLSMSDPSSIDDAGNSLSRYGSARKLGHGEPAERFDQVREVFSVCAGAAGYRQSFFDAVGGFDASFHSYFEDVDLCLRGRLLGFRYLFEPRAEVLHYGHGSGMNRGHYVFRITRNRLATLFKSLPGPLVRRHWRSLAFAQLYFALAYLRPLHSVAGWAAFLGRLAPLARERRRLARVRVLRSEELDRLLERDLGEPPLRELVKRRLRAARRSPER